MSRKSHGKSYGAPWSIFVIGASFLAGMVTMSALNQIYSDSVTPVSAKETPAAPAPEPGPKPEPEPPKPVTVPVPASPPPESAVPVIEANPIAELRARDLKVPLKGGSKSDVKDMFNEMRGTSHRHEAVDMLAPRMTPVLAVEDGTIARLFISKAGGITIYQFDPAQKYCYYYAHLERYASGLKEGMTIKRGDEIAYVGTTGNAPPNTPHLHFAIFKLTDQKQWWKGTAIDPYQVFK